MGSRRRSTCFRPAESEPRSRRRSRPRSGRRGRRRSRRRRAREVLGDRPRDLLEHGRFAPMPGVPASRRTGGRRDVRACPRGRAFHTLATVGLTLADEGAKTPTRLSYAPVRRSGTGYASGRGRTSTRSARGARAQPPPARRVHRLPCASSTRTRTYGPRYRGQPTRSLERVRGSATTP